MTIKNMKLSKHLNKGKNKVRVFCSWLTEKSERKEALRELQELTKKGKGFRYLPVQGLVNNLFQLKILHQ